jgi:hypothetical protein
VSLAGRNLPNINAKLPILMLTTMNHTGVWVHKHYNIYFIFYNRGMAPIRFLNHQHN